MTAARIAYDKEAAAEAVSVSQRVIDNAIRSGDLIAHTVTAKAGSKVLIGHDELVSWFQALPTRTAS